ncbi:MAG: dethiobiotin synthetase [Thiomicrorhabdus sp.]|nr:MAG: dethiobiotin synthetase [Thiomicrorhabdus sp.]
MNSTEHRPVQSKKTTDHGGFFVTGTDTDVGKTFVAGCIAISLIEEGISFAPRKPIASGCPRQEDGSLLAEDALFLQQSSQSTESLETICPYQFEPVISPHTAIKQANVPITLSDLLVACKTRKNQLALVEGSGGFYSPIAMDGLNKDLAIKLSYPIILVVANRLGCINQTLLNIQAIEAAGLCIHSIILNQVSASTEINYAEGLEGFTSYPIFETTFSIEKNPKAIKDWCFNLESSD